MTRAGAGRQLTLKLADPIVETIPGRCSGGPKSGNRSSYARGLRACMSPDDDLVLFRRVRASLRRRPVRDFARTLRDTVAAEREFVCLITDDLGELRRLNRQFRGFDHATDVLSFPSTDRESIGEIAISADRATVQARVFGHSVADEIRILMLHGVLHLLGMDHETDRGRMARAEARWRRKLLVITGELDRQGVMTFTLLLAAGLLYLVGELNSLVQLLYLESMRLRTRDTPALDFF